MSPLKKIISLLLIVLIFFSVSACNLLDDSVPKEKIVEFVMKHQDKLIECAQKGDFSEFEGLGIVKSVYESAGYTELYCGGKGLAGGSSYYCGFYYSPQDSKTAMWQGLAVRPEGKGFVYEEEDGANRFYSEKIFDCFYFYEQSY